MTTDPSVLAAIAARLQGMTLTPERAEELAREVDRMNRTCLDATERFTALEDPRSFLGLLVELSRAQTSLDDGR